MQFSSCRGLVVKCPDNTQNTQNSIETHAASEQKDEDTENDISIYKQTMNGLSSNNKS